MANKINKLAGHRTVYWVDGRIEDAPYPPWVKRLTEITDIPSIGISEGHVEVIRTGNASWMAIHDEGRIRSLPLNYNASKRARRYIRGNAVEFTGVKLK